MQVNSDPTTPRSQEGTETFPDIVALYLHYWETYILPIEEPARQLAFLDILLSVADRLYGREVFSEICMGIFVSDK